MAKKIKLGVKARCKITGFEGIVTGRSTWLTGCDQYVLKPGVDKDGKSQKGEWFDEGVLEVIGEGIHEKEVQAPKKGGPRRDAPKV